MIELYVDGLCEPTYPNGLGCYGFIAFRDKKKIRIGKGCIGFNSTNNIAEYKALIEALKVLEIEPDEEIMIYTDSQTLSNHLTDNANIRTRHLIDLHDELVIQLRDLNWNIKWIPRGKNRTADQLSKYAFKKAKKLLQIRPFYENKKLEDEYRSCYYCKWLEYTGTHSGCYIGGIWRGWVPKRKLKKGSCIDWTQQR